MSVGERLGVEYRLSTDISRIMLSPDGARAIGVQQSDGTPLSADIIICNADLVYAYNNLLPRTAYATSLTERPTSCSSLSFYWALSKQVPELSAHNIFLADQYRASFDSIFKDHLIPDEPSFYVNVPSRVDPSAAPDGTDALMVLVPVGHLQDPDAGSSHSAGMPGEVPRANRQDWPAIRAKAREQVIAGIQARTGVDISPLIVHEQCNDPQMWKDTFNLDRGAILGLSHSFFNVLSFRPSTRHAKISGLYFVGASTHPGTGVPICLAGSKIVAEQVLRDHAMVVPWSEGGLKPRVVRTGKGHEEALDEIQERWLDGDILVWGFVTGLMLFVAWFAAWFIRSDRYSELLSMIGTRKK
jgi:phytoene desaturase (3,4-didehydrolycopene-forming)